MKSIILGFVLSTAIYAQTNNTNGMGSYEFNCKDYMNNILGGGLGMGMIPPLYVNDEGKIQINNDALEEVNMKKNGNTTEYRIKNYYTDPTTNKITEFETTINVSNDENTKKITKISNKIFGSSKTDIKRYKKMAAKGFVTKNMKGGHGYGSEWDSLSKKEQRKLAREYRKSRKDQKKLNKYYQKITDTLYKGDNFRMPMENVTEFGYDDNGECYLNESYQNVLTEDKAGGKVAKSISFNKEYCEKVIEVYNKNQEEITKCAYKSPSLLEGITAISTLEGQIRNTGVQPKQSSKAYGIPFNPARPYFEMFTGGVNEYAGSWTGSYYGGGLFSISHSDLQMAQITCKQLIKAKSTDQTDNPTLNGTGTVNER